MEEKPRIVISTTRERRIEETASRFNFNADQIPQTGSLADFRQQAWQTYCGLPLPSMADKAWRRTDLRELPVNKLRLPQPGVRQGLAPVPARLLKPLVPGRSVGLVIDQAELTKNASGQNFGVHIDPELEKQGVIFTDLQTAEREYPELVSKLAGRLVPATDGIFAALSAALAQNGVLLYVPKGVHVEQPLQSIMWGSGKNLAHFSHILVWVDDGASATYVHEAASPNNDDEGMHAGIVSITVGKEAALKFIELQSWGRGIWNFSHERARVDNAGSLEWIFSAVGSRLTKSFSEMVLSGEGASGKISGLFFSSGNQHFDHDTRQSHLAARTTSNLIVKGALMGQSRSIWQGMIHVAANASNTDGYQANRNLVLSSQARADSIPGLEILTDDVRCSHASTVGKLEQEPLFYLKSRGIPDGEATRLLVEGFFDQIMNCIPFASIRARINQVIQEKMATQ